MAFNTSTSSLGLSLDNSTMFNGGDMDNVTSVSNTTSGNFTLVQNNGNGNDTFSPYDPLHWYPDRKFEYIIEIFSTALTVFGAIGNFITIVKIAADKKLHAPTYVAIACIAIPDFLSLVLGYCVTYRMKEAFASVTYLLEAARAFGFAAENSSAVHMILLSGLRYSLTVHPLWSKINLTAKTVIVISVIGWVFSFVVGILYAFYGYEFDQGRVDLDTAIILDVCLWVYLLLIPCAIVIAFHLKKLTAIKQSISAVSLTLTTKMSRIFLAILIIYVLTCVADLTYKCLLLRQFLLGFDIDSFTVFYYTDPFVFIIWLLHYMANPWILFMCAPPVKNFFRRLLSSSFSTEVTT